MILNGVRSTLLLAAALLAGSQLATAGPSIHHFPAAGRLLQCFHRRNESGVKGYCKPRRHNVNEGNDTALPEEGGTATVHLPPIETMPLHPTDYAYAPLQQSQSIQESLSLPSGSSQPATGQAPPEAQETWSATTEYVDITSYVTLTPSLTLVKASSSSYKSVSQASTTAVSSSSAAGTTTSLPQNSVPASSLYSVSSRSTLASSSTSAASSVVATSTVPSATPSSTPSHGCPAGTSYQTFTDDFVRICINSSLSLH